MKKSYLEPCVQVERFTVEDVINTSYGTPIIPFSMDGTQTRPIDSDSIA